MGYIFDALNRGGQKSDESKKPLADISPTSSDDIQQSLKLAQSVDGEQNQDSADPKQAPEIGAPASPTVSVSMPTPQLAGGKAELDYSDVDERLVSLTNPSCVIAEEYRSIRTGLLAKWENRRHLVHTITSATPQEGKTITSLNMGLIMAELHNRKTLVIEADLRLPQFKKLLNLPQSYGLVGVLRGEASFKDALLEVGPNGLHVLPAGTRVNNEAVQLLSSPQMSSMIKKLKREYDHIIIDTPPVVELADAGILGAMSDDVILVARMGRTPSTLIRQAIRTLESYRAPVAGVIATDHSRSFRQYYYYRYGYRYQNRYYSQAA
ncbi:MAG: CpsD/CapB family tyrosine-protein kinase [Phycisphaeraceae bacterium]|nr:CpsD/CapB family tyrosine-protein kinase [Phycisphaeraceae bacterium]